MTAAIQDEGSGEDRGDKAEGPGAGRDKPMTLEQVNNIAAAARLAMRSAELQFQACHMVGDVTGAEEERLRIHGQMDSLLDCIFLYVSKTGGRA